MVLCRVCYQEFTNHEQRKGHEQICSLSLPPGSVWQCCFCGVMLPIFAYSSFLEHESRCSLNPVVQECNSYIQRASVDGRNKLFSDVEKDARASDAPYCYCPVTPMACVVRISTSKRNPGRLYYRCAQQNSVDRCRFFQWAD
jgi:GRF zinc finger